MSILKISKHSDVPAALDLVRDEVDKEARCINLAGGAAQAAGNLKLAKEAIAYAEKLGAADVAKLGVTVGGEPLVTQDKSLFKKHPTAVAEIGAGWYVKTHSGTAAKIGYVKKIAKALKVKVTIQNV